jgi:hypothetical protein
MFRILLFLSCLICFSDAFSQVKFSQPNRLELEIKSDENVYLIASAKEEGLILFRETKEHDKSYNYKWEFIRYDTALTQIWNNSFHVEKDYTAIGYEYRDESFYALFHRKFTSSSTSYKLVKMSMESGDTLHYNIRNLAPIDLTDFTVIGDYAIFIGNVNSRASVLTYNMKEKRVKVLQGFYKPHSEVQEIKLDPNKNLYNVVLTERTADKKVTVSLKTFDFEGNSLANITLKPHGNYHLLDARSTMWSENGSIILSGTYALKRNYYSNGIFIATISDKGQQINYFPFGAMQNFFINYPPNKAEKLRNKYQSKARRGKDVKINFRSLLNEVTEVNEKYVMVTEFFYPNTHSGSNYNYFFTPAEINYGPHPRTFQIVGYKFTHALAAAFDASGRLIWDNAIKFKDLTTPILKSNSRIAFANDTASLFYLQQNVIHAKKFAGLDSFEEVEAIEVKLNSDEDKFKHGESYDGVIERWYGNYFFVSGLQRVKNTSGIDFLTNKKVFYINKLEFK